MKKLILLTLIFLLTGCSSYLELNDLAIIDTIGIEKINDEYKLYVSLIEEVDTNTLKPKTKLLKLSGTNLNDILEKLNLYLNQKIYLAHLNLLLVNNSLNTLDYQNIINYFSNNNDTRKDFLIAYTNDLETVINQAKFQQIKNLIEINHQETSQVITTTMNDIIRNYKENEPIYLTNVIYDEAIKLSGMISFYHNNYSHYIEEESIFINYILDEIKSYNYKYQCQNNNYLNLKIMKSNSIILKNKLIIINNINTLTNNCNLNNQEIENIFTSYLKNNIKKYTNKEINIKNLIRGNYENK